MRARHVVSIGPCGELHGLQTQGGLPLHLLGDADIERVSEILWSKQDQKWTVVFLKGPLKKRPVAREDLKAYNIAAPCMKENAAGALLFDDYSHGVAIEIALVEASLLRGEQWGREAA